MTSSDCELLTIDKHSLQSDLLLVSYEDIHNEHYWDPWLAFPQSDSLVGSEAVNNQVNISEADDCDHVSDSGSSIGSETFPLLLSAGFSSAKGDVNPNDTLTGNSSTVRVATTSNSDNVSASCSATTSNSDNVSASCSSANADINPDDTPTGSHSSIHVATTNNSHNRRKWDKQYYCLFCSKPVSKLPRHLERCHHDTTEVAHLMTLPLKSKRRRLLLKKLLYRGNYLHNCEVLRAKAGKLIPLKRPSKSCSAADFIPCEFCLGFFARHDLWKHRKRCQFKECSSANGASSNVRCQARGSILLPVSCEANDDFKQNILSVMNQDEAVTAIRNDDLVMKFGTRLYFKHGHHHHRRQYIRERLRQLGRLLVEVKKLDSSVSYLSDCISSDKFSAICDAVHRLCGFDSVTHIYKTPSLALKIGHSLKECARIEIGTAMQASGSSGKEKVKVCQNFVRLCDMEWNQNVSSHALRSLRQSKFNKPTVLPLAKDVKQLQLYLKTSAKQHLDGLMDNVDVTKNWTELCRTTLTQVVLLNRRRGGEAERMLVASFLQAQQNRNTNFHDDIQESLSTVELALCKMLMLVEIEGKRGRKVPVLLTQELQSQMNALIQKRSAAGVVDGNVFVFARPGCETPQRSSDCLRKYSQLCGALSPASLTSTRLRKNIATMSQVLALRKNELDLLAGFLGHDGQIHREYYRLPQQTLQIAKLSKLLLAMDKGEISSLVGKSLDDINVNVNGEKYCLLFLCGYYF